MKLNIKFIYVVIIFCMSSNLFAYNERKDFFYRPQLGLWFGINTPALQTADLVDTNLGGGLLARYNLPFRPLKIGLDASYQAYQNDGVNELTLVPVYANLIYLLPFNLPVKLQIKAGAGANYLYALPDDISQWDPLFMGGVEMSFPAGRIVNIGLRIDYIYIYQAYIQKGSDGGHFVNAGITLFFNLN